MDKKPAEAHQSESARFEALEHRVAALELALVGAPTRTPVAPATDYRSAPPPVVAGMSTSRKPQIRPEGTPDVVPPAPRKAGLSLRTSEALLKWAGIGLVVLAVVFALGLAIERGWITPALRVAASSLVGVLLFITGQRIRKQRLVFAETLQGAAFVVLYLTALSMLVMDLVTGTVGLAAMVGVTLAALAAASLLDSPPIAVLGILGGLATPLLLADGIDDPGFLAFYIPLLAGAGWVVYSWTGWRSVAIATAGAAWLLMADLVRLSPTAMMTSVSIIIVGVAAWLVPLGRSLLEARRRVNPRPAHFMEDALAPALKGTTDRLVYAAPLITLGLLSLVVELSRYQWSPIVAATGVMFGLVAVALARGGFTERAYVHTTLAALLGAIGLTLALDGEVLLVSLPLQGIALTFIARRLGHRLMSWQANITFALALVAVMVRSVDRGFDGSPATALWLSELAVLGIAAWRASWRDEARIFFGPVVHLLTLGWLFSVLGDPWVILAVVGLYAAARMVAHFGLLELEASIPINALAILLITVAAAVGHYGGELEYDSGRVALLGVGVLVLAGVAHQSPRLWRPADSAVAYLTLLAWIVAAAGSSDAWFTGGWVVVGLGTLGWGMRKAATEAQTAGWVTLAAATAKLLLVDLEATDPLVRIVLFFGIGVSFLALAYLLPTRLAAVDPAPSDDAELESSIR